MKYPVIEEAGGAIHTRDNTEIVPVAQLLPPLRRQWKKFIYFQVSLLQIRTVPDHGVGGP